MRTQSSLGSDIDSIRSILAETSLPGPPAPEEFLALVRFDQPSGIPSVAPARATGQSLPRPERPRFRQHPTPLRRQMLTVQLVRHSIFIAASPNSHLDHPLAAVLAGQQSDQRLGRVLEAVDDVLLDLQLS